MSSLLHDGDVAFTISYLTIISVLLIVFLKYLKRTSLWGSIIAGAVSGYAAGLCSYLIAISTMSDGIERLANTASLDANATIIMVAGIPIVLLCWLWGAIGFLIVCGISKR